MGSWVHGFMGSWVHGFMGSWVHGFMGSWVHATIGFAEVVGGVKPQRTVGKRIELYAKRCSALQSFVAKVILSAISRKVWPMLGLFVSGVCPVAR